MMTYSIREVLQRMHFLHDYSFIYIYEDEQRLRW